MLGRNANGIYWMTRYVERSENIARLIEAGLRMSLTRAGDVNTEWASVLETAGVSAAFADEYGKEHNCSNVTNFLLRDKANSRSVLATLEGARTNARMVRTALTREVWESVNECWLSLSSLLSRPVREADLSKTLEIIRRQSGLIRGAMLGTMLRNDIYNFARIGTFIERADSTARILDVKYYVLLPSLQHVGSSLDNVQWESILRSVSAHTSFRYIYGTEYTSKQIAELLIFEMRLPRSLLFCQAQIVENLNYLAAEYNERTEAHDVAEALFHRLKQMNIAQVFDSSLHTFLQDYLRDNNNVGASIDKAFRFYD